MIQNLEHDPRVALEVTRYHTWRRIRDQSVGEHSAQMQRILLTVWPSCPRKLLVAVLLHDIGEMAGDVPWAGKRSDPVLKERMDAAEARIHAGMTERWGLPAMPTLSDYEYSVLKICDYLEAWECALVEQNMGNRYAQVVALRMLVAASEVMERLAPPPSGDYPDVRPALRRYVEARKDHENPLRGQREEPAMSPANMRTSYNERGEPTNG